MTVFYLLLAGLVLSVQAPSGGRDWRRKTLCLTCCWDVLAKCSKLESRGRRAFRHSSALVMDKCAACDIHLQRDLSKGGRHVWYTGCMLGSQACSAPGALFYALLRSPRWRQISAALEGGTVIWWWIWASSESNVTYRSPGAIMGYVYQIGHRIIFVPTNWVLTMNIFFSNYTYLSAALMW